MICKHCGRELPDNAQFCASCGMAMSNSMEEQYQEAIHKMNCAKKEDEYIKIAEIFENIGEYKDAVLYKQQCLEKAEKTHKDDIYIKALNKMDSMTTSGYETAIELFSQIPGWKESDKKLLICRQKLDERQQKDAEDKERAAIEDDKAKAKKRNGQITFYAIVACVLIIAFSIRPLSYFAAIKTMEAGNIELALEKFKKLKKYKDSIRYVEKLTMKLQDDAVEDESIEIGDTIEFGMYELDKNESNGKEPLKWDVVAIEDGKMLLYCKHVVEYKEFDKHGSDLWEYSSLREWLNTSFYDKAFNKDLQARILCTDRANTTGWYISDVEKHEGWDAQTTWWLHNGKAPNTLDMVFVCSMDEYFKYKDEGYGFYRSLYMFEKGEEIVCYDSDNYHYSSPNTIDDINWWMSSSGEDGQICVIQGSGGIATVDAYEKLGVCPMIWISTK